jgi:outer membrane protein assembly factor BamA
MGLLAVTTGLLISAPTWSQSPADSKSCISAALANEKSHTNSAERGQASDEKGEAHRKVIVDRIEFDRPVNLSSSDIEQTITRAHDSKWNADSPDWVDEMSEIELRSAWQDQGYFKAAVDVHARSIGGDSNIERFVVAVHVLNEGHQYHLGNLKFVEISTIPEAELREVFPLHEGELFSVERIRVGIRALTNLYASHGYLDFTAVPETEIDENLQRISLVMHLDEQRQFRVGTVDIQGLDPVLEAKLRSLLVPGEVFNGPSIDTYFKENRPLIPRGMDNFEIRRNVRTGIVDLMFDPRLCH